MKVGVIGAGTMGQGIAQTFADNDHYQVLLCDVSAERAEQGKIAIANTLKLLKQKGKIDEVRAARILDNISAGTLKQTGSCDIIIEAIAENIKIKQSLFQELDRICENTAIFATNTSSLSISELSAAVNRPVVGMHFFNPVPVMKLVEVVKAADTPDETVQKVQQIARDIGKVPVEVNEQPGFVVNRILIPMINEAIGVYAMGVASAEDIDTAMKLGANHPIGPLALADLIGLDVCLAIMEVLQAGTKDPKYRPEPLLSKMVRDGRLGKKSGQGFYQY